MTRNFFLMLFRMALGVASGFPLLEFLGLRGREVYGPRVRYAREHIVEEGGDECADGSP